MLIEFSVENFRSFRDRQTLSLVASNDDSLPGNCFQVKGHHLLRSAVVYGPNASGKSNLIKALDFVSEFIGASEQRKGRAPREAVPFRLDAKTVQKPSFFETVFLVDGTQFRYGLKVSGLRVYAEWLYASPRGREQLWFRREHAKGRATPRWRFGTRLKGQKSQAAKMTADDRPFLAVASELNNKQLRDVRASFTEHLGVFSRSSTWVGRHALALAPSKGVVWRKLLDFLHRFDVSIDRIQVEKVPASEFLEGRLPSDKMTAAEMVAIMTERITPVAVTTFHRARGKKGLVPFRLEEESDGTQRLFGLAAYWVPALLLGRALVVDELESSLHPMLSRQLLALFNDPKSNKANGQLICATHDTNLMDLKLLRRDQIWFTEKDQDGASHLYSLYDFKKKPRKDEAIQKGYLAGRYGALPVLVDDDAE